MRHKTAKCKNCGKKNDAEKSLFINLKAFCDYTCATDFGKKNIDKGKKERNKQIKRDLKEFKANDKSVLTPKAQQAFNAYIRERDRHLPCISCNRHHSGQYHAGHYKTVGARKDLRFNEDNCHKQCSVCNNHLSGNLAEYTINLIKKIGQDRFDKLEKVEIKSYSVEELKEIIKTYKDKLKQLKESEE